MDLAVLLQTFADAISQLYLSILLLCTWLSLMSIFMILFLTPIPEYTHRYKDILNTMNCSLGMQIMVGS